MTSLQFVQILLSIGGSFLAALVTVASLSRKMVTKEDIVKIENDISDIKTDTSQHAQTIAVHEWRLNNIDKILVTNTRQEV